MKTFTDTFKQLVKVRGSCCGLQSELPHKARKLRVETHEEINISSSMINGKLSSHNRFQLLRGNKKHIIDVHGLTDELSI